MDTLALRRIDSLFWPLATLVGRAGARLPLPGRTPTDTPLILRPGGMGDLILLCVALEEFGLDPRSFAWLIERRSAPWARHVRLDYQCYDDGLAATHWRIARRYRLVINTEQLHGLSQATALLARAPGGRVVCFDTNRAARLADQVVSYDPLVAHEAVEFGRLLAAALGRVAPDRQPVRTRRMAATEPAVVGLGGLQSETRKLDERQWVALIEAWRRDRPLLISATPMDRAFAERVCARLDRTRLFTGDFDAVCDLVAHAGEVFTIDSGFMHIASYYGVPTTTIFTSSRERKWASLAPGSHLVRRTDLSCQPCAMYALVPPCPHGFACREVEFARDYR